MDPHNGVRPGDAKWSEVEGIGDREHCSDEADCNGQPSDRRQYHSSLAAEDAERVAGVCAGAGPPSGRAGLPYISTGLARSLRTAPKAQDID
jgi:hypothetical protein